MVALGQINARPAVRRQHLAATVAVSPRQADLLADATNDAAVARRAVVADIARQATDLLTDAASNAGVARDAVVADATVARQADLLANAAADAAVTTIDAAVAEATVATIQAAVAELLVEQRAVATEADRGVVALADVDAIEVRQLDCGAICGATMILVG